MLVHQRPAHISDAFSLPMNGIFNMTMSHLKQFANKMLHILKVQTCTYSRPICKSLLGVLKQNHLNWALTDYNWTFDWKLWFSSKKKSGGLQYLNKRKIILTLLVLISKLEVLRLETMWVFFKVSDTIYWRNFIEI